MAQYIEFVEELDPCYATKVGSSRRMEWLLRLSNPVNVATLVGAMGIAAALVAGSVLSSVEANAGTPHAHPTACMLEMAGAKEHPDDPALLVSLSRPLLVEPWDAATNSWVPGMVLTTFVIFRRYILPVVVAKHYPGLPHDKQIKISNYMLEIVGTTFGLVVTSVTGYWTLLLMPSVYDDITPQQGHNLAVGLQLLASTFVAMYGLEISYDLKMRMGLTLHHLVSMFLVLWALPVCHLVDNHVKFIRASFVLTLYMSTEQGVFVEMLLYHKRCYWAVAFTMNAWFYTVTRVAIAVASLWTWWEAKEVIFESGTHNNPLVYGLWIFVPFANLILNTTQATTVQSLFGIAASVRRRKIQSKIQENVVDAFIQMDFDQKGTLEKVDVENGIKGLGLEVVVPQWGFDVIFSAMDVQGSHMIGQTEFVDFFIPFMLPGVSFDLVLTALVLRALLDDTRSTADSGKREVWETAYRNTLDRMEAVGLAGSPKNFGVEGRRISAVQDDFVRAVNRLGSAFPPQVEPDLSTGEEAPSTANPAFGEAHDHVAELERRLASSEEMVAALQAQMKFREAEHAEEKAELAAKKAELIAERRGVQHAVRRDARAAAAQEPEDVPNLRRRRSVDERLNGAWTSA